MSPELRTIDFVMSRPVGIRKRMQRFAIGAAAIRLSFEAAAAAIADDQDMEAARQAAHRSADGFLFEMFTTWPEFKHRTTEAAWFRRRMHLNIDRIISRMGGFPPAIDIAALAQVGGDNPNAGGNYDLDAPDFDKHKPAAWPTWPSGSGADMENSRSER